MDSNESNSKKVERSIQAIIKNIENRNDPDKFYFSSQRKYSALKREFERKIKKSS